MRLAEQDAKAQLDSLHKRYAQTFRELIQGTDWHRKPSLESHARRAANELCETLKQRADLIEVALERNVRALPDGQIILEEELV